MKTLKTTINEDFCFNYRGYSIKETQEAFMYYQQKKKDASEWLLQSDIPIFLDTNVLLDLYRISLSERESFRNFLIGQKSRIFITKQVEVEYLRHRLRQINNFAKKINKFLDNYKQFQNGVLLMPEKILDSISEFKRSNSLTGDIGNKVFDEIEKRLRGDVINEQMTFLKESMERGAEELRAYVNECKSKTHYEYEDPFLEAISGLNVQSDLSNKEKDFLKERYNKLLEEYNKEKEDSEEVSYFTFPGCGDRSKFKEKKEPYGDFYIYHELLRYVKENDKDVLFVTNDLTKSDWVKGSTREMYPHYIVNIHSLTKRMIYILSASELIPMSFEAIVPDVSNESNKMEDEVKNEVGFESNDDNSDILQIQPTFGDPEQLIKEQHSIFKYISKENFVRELSTALKWAKDYGSNYISETYFIHGILGSKRYEFQHSKDILQELVNTGQVTSTLENHDGRDIQCLQLNIGLQNE